ncbi:MAG: serine/threonine-protein kinase [Anaerolineae bacterium]|nr:serine/threonine-protein kinase [Anaerolineae bacterium]
MIGRTLGSYRIVEQIGVGGMATVYKAYDPGTDRYVALKVLPDYYSQDPKFRQRFEREAKAIAKLEHLHILPVHAYGEEGDTAYLVMRYMETGTLKDRVQAGPMPLDEVGRLLAQIASALDYAHQHGVLHRDVKPSNVLLDAESNAYLTDFGIAKMIEGTSELTGSGIIGTPQYMSPEQCQGRKDLTGATDVYSLGVVLYEMLTGRTPYQAETPLAIIHMQLTNSPLPPPSSIRAELTEETEAVVLKALAQDPDSRWPTCGAMAKAFAKVVVEGQKATRPSAPTKEVSLPAAPLTEKLALEDDLATTMPAFVEDKKDVAATDAAAATPQVAGHRPPAWVLALAALLIIAVVLVITWQSGLFGRPRVVVACEEDHALCVGRLGKEPRVIFADERLLVGGPTWSPDGKQIAFHARKPGEDRDTIHIINADGSELRRLSDLCNDINPAWSPDGDWIAFHSCAELVLMSTDGSREVHLGNECALMPQWSPDSSSIVVSVGLEGRCADKRPLAREVRVISRDGKMAKPLVTTIFEGEQATLAVAFSPDGKQVAYVDERGQAWLVPVEGEEKPIRIDNFPFEWTGKVYPQWSK